MPKVAAALIASLKNMAGGNSIAKILPQDGGFNAIIDDFPIDVRLSTSPAKFGEIAVIRILDPKMVERMTIKDLGFNEHNEKRFLELMTAPNGIFAITGPVGAGKTTTINTALRWRLQKEGNAISIRTIEDPVEYSTKGLGQTQVNEKQGLTFPVALKSFLGQDPDIILVGEIRDSLTASIAVEAANTGMTQLGMDSFSEGMENEIFVAKSLGI